MTVAISFRNVSAANIFDRLSLEIESGCSALIVASAKNEGELLLRLITGIALPEKGAVHILGQSLADLDTAQIYLLRQQIGVVPSNGGLISNLKVWENITLPILYNTGEISDEIEERAINRLKQLGYSGNVMEMPALLSTYEKRVAAFIRATLTQPRIVVYDHCLEDMSTALQKSFVAATTEFQAATPGRTSIYLMPSPNMAADLNADIIINIHNPT